MSEASYSGTQTFTNLGSPEGRISFGNDIQSDTFVEGSAGWRLERDTGDGEFSNVTVRGTSTVESSAIGGDAAIGWSQVGDDDSTLGGMLNGTLGAGVTSITTPQQLMAADVSAIDGRTASHMDGTSTIIGRLTSGMDATSETQYSDSSVDVTFTFQYSDSSGSILSSEAQTFTYGRDDFTFVTSQGAVSPVRTFRPAFTDITIPNNAAVCSLRVSFQFEAGSSWGIADFTAIQYRFAALVPKPTTAAAYISSPNLNQFALDVAGGRGARLGAVELFRGSVTSVQTFGAELRGEETLYVLVSWDDINAPEILLNTQTTVAFPISSQPAIADVDTSGEFLIYSSSPAIYNSAGQYIGALTIVQNKTTISLITTGAASNISNQRIRRIWSKFK